MNSECFFFFLKFSWNFQTKRRLSCILISCFYFYNKSEIDVTMSRRSQMWFELVTHKKFRIQIKTNCCCNSRTLKLQSLLHALFHGTNEVSKIICCNKTKIANNLKEKRKFPEQLTVTLYFHFVCLTFYFLCMCKRKLPNKPK